MQDPTYRIIITDFTARCKWRHGALYAVPNLCYNEV